MRNNLQRKVQGKMKGTTKETEKWTEKESSPNNRNAVKIKGISISFIGITNYWLNPMHLLIKFEQHALNPLFQRPGQRIFNFLFPPSL